MATTSAQPPQIPGLVYRGFLGSGGFADVYLYESTSPKRNVAVKVLHEKAMGGAAMAKFVAEANTMAALEHPYIVRVYSSGVTVDGRPYIEMAYYSEPTLAQAVKKGPLPVPEVLRIGVQLASAIEAAHSVGMLHRDIKPANVLMDKFGDPALTDFGIASAFHEADDAEASVSVPWAPPEAMFSTATLDQRCDIYSLAATLWNLLTGHSPFEVLGGDNKPKTMMLRVRDLPVPVTGRGDVPQSLELLLKQAMSKEPRLRPATAESFARSLNAIEEELHLRPTPFKIARTTPFTPAESEPQAGDGTRMRSAPNVVQASHPDQTRMRSVIDPTRRHAIAVAEVAPAPSMKQTSLSPDETEPPSRRSRVSLVVALVCIVVVIAGVGAWIYLAPTPVPDPIPPNPSVSADDGFGETYPGTVFITGAVEGNQAVFTWDYDFFRDDDSYYVLVGGTDEVRVEDPTYTADYNGQQVCIQVEVVRASGKYVSPTWSTKGCTP